MIVTNYTTEDLKKLPLRAIVALAARCARRVEYLGLLPDGHPEKERCRTAVANAIRLAEDFAKGSPCGSLESVVREVEACRAVAQGDFVRETAVGAIVRAAHAAASALDALGLRDEPEEVSVLGTRQPNPFPTWRMSTADLAARDAFTAAVDAAGADGHADKFVNGSRPGLSGAPAARPRQLSRGRQADRPLARGAARAARSRDPREPRRPRFSQEPAPSGDLHDRRQPHSSS